MKWNNENLELLQKLHEDGQSIQSIANHFGVSVNAIKSIVYRRNNEQFTRRRDKYIKWTPQLEQQVISMIKDSLSLQDIADKLNISYASLTSKMRRLDVNFHGASKSGYYTPKDVLSQFHMTESQLRQALNQRQIACVVKGKRLMFYDMAFADWLAKGYAFIYFPKDDADDHWKALWQNAYKHALYHVATMDEIADTFGVSKMSITYYGKKKNFPSSITYIRSYNTYDRLQVNEWALAHNMNTLPEIIGSKYYENITYFRPDTKKLYDKYVSDLTSPVIDSTITN